MEWVLLHMLYRVCPQSGEFYAERTVKTDELQAVGHDYICNFVTFSVGLDYQRHEILNAQCYADIRAPIGLLCKMFLLFHSPRNP